jgi:hypothetical protein
MIHQSQTMNHFEWKWTIVAISSPIPLPISRWGIILAPEAIIYHISGLWLGVERIHSASVRLFANASQYNQLILLSSSLMNLKRCLALSLMIYLQISIGERYPTNYESFEISRNDLLLERMPV